MVKKIDIVGKALERIEVKGPALPRIEPAELAAALNAEPVLAATHAGPVLWDVDGSDWDHWRQGRSPRQCAATYLDRVEESGRGIVLMHDCTADSDEINAANRTYEAVRLLLPELRRRGYDFAGLPG